MEIVRRLIQRTPFVSGIYSGYLKEFEEFRVKNRSEVLWMYRTFLKVIPHLYDRKLEIVRKRKVIQLKWDC